MAAIEHGNGQQVEHAQVDAEHGHKPQQIGKTAFSALSHHLENPHRPGQILAGVFSQARCL